MSVAGIGITAKVLSVMQEGRQELLRMSCPAIGPLSESQKQDLLLAQLLETIKESVKNEFCQITLMNCNQQEVVCQEVQDIELSAP
jgi:hypothetical protein